MADIAKDIGVLAALAERFQTQRLPRALAIKERVDGGERLSDPDIEFLSRVFEDAQQLKPYMDRHPEWHSIVSRVLALYKEITTKALENEKSAGTRKG